VHICTTDDGRAVTDAKPMITIQPVGLTTITEVDVATMQGIGAPKSDIHYGNNVSVAPGTKYLISVTLDDATATFELTA
jgi:hypothetical protein